MANKEHQEKAKPVISIIIPAYNREKFVPQLINYIKGQTFADYECIIVDDGSEDQTGELCDSLTADDDRFIIRHTRNYGVSHARNVALEIARGEYITFVDSDDSIPEDYLEKLIRNLKIFHVDMVIGSFCKVYTDGKIRKMDYPFKDSVYLLKELLPSFAEKQKKYGVYGVCVGKLFARKLAPEVRFDESIHLAEDFDYYLRVYPYVQKIYFDNTCEYGYFAGAENSSIQVDDENIDYIAQLKISIRYKKFLENSGVFTGENERIVSEQILNYAFFAVFHSNSNNFHVTFQTACELISSSGIQYRKVGGLKDIILKSIFRKNEAVAAITMKAYHAARKVLRGH